MPFEGSEAASDQTCKHKQLMQWQACKEGRTIVGIAGEADHSIRIAQACHGADEETLDAERAKPRSLEKSGNCGHGRVHEGGGHEDPVR